MALNSLPIEVIELVQSNLDGGSFARLSRLNSLWFGARLNVERHLGIWKRFCCKEIDPQVIDEINGNANRRVDDFSEVEARRVYQKWFRNKQLSGPIEEVVVDDPAFADINNLRVVKVSGKVIVTGHRSGQVNVIDVNNGQTYQTSRLMEPIIDIQLIDLLGRDVYQLHKYGQDPANYPTPSHSSHHHVMTLSKDRRIQLFPIVPHEYNKNSTFTIQSMYKSFVAIRVSGQLLVTATENREISCFRISFPPDFNPSEDSLLVGLEIHQLGRIRCCDYIEKNWLGLFGIFNDVLTVFCDRSNLALTIDVQESLQQQSEDKPTLWKEKSMVEVEFADLSRDVYLTNGCAFRGNVFFLFDSCGHVFMTSDCRLFHKLPIFKDLDKFDRITAICLWGSLFAVASANGMLLVYKCCDVRQLLTLDQMKPVFRKKLTKHDFKYIDINDDGESPVILAATDQSIFVLKWNRRRIVEDY